LSGVLRLAFFDALRGLGNVRWLVVPPLLLLAAFFQADWVGFDYATGRAREVNLWDLPFSMVSSSAVGVFLFSLGFVLVSGDLFVRDYASGTAAMTLLRSRDRFGWWTAKILSLSVLALSYSIIAFASILAVGAALFPWKLDPSPAAQIPWGDPNALYPRFEALPMPAFFLLVVTYTSLALWAVGAVVLLVSTLHPHTLVPLAFGFGWVVILSWVIAPVYQREGLGALDPMYQVSYAVHFGTPVFGGVSWLTSFAVVFGSLALALLVGAWKLRRTDM
jgi:hypothetical protein